MTLLDVMWPAVAITILAVIWLPGITILTTRHAGLEAHEERTDL